MANSFDTQPLHDSRKPLDAHVIIATKGRPECLPHLLTWLNEQTLAPKTIVVVGTQESDVATLRGASVGSDTPIHILLSSRAGLCIQRNLGLDELRKRGVLGADSDPASFVAFFDDDFRPAPDWLAQCAQLMSTAPDVAALSGRVLADGVHGTLISEDDVEAYFNGTKPAEPHWASGPETRDLGSMYGCNMAFRSVVFWSSRFDENLPLYGWQEDQDMTGQARKWGRTLYHPKCRGVHLGSTSARVSGVRFGYSQIANPLYLVTKGTMSRRKTTQFLAKHLMANTVRSVATKKVIDYPGRLRGNLLAIVDVVRGRCHPTRILDL